MAIRFDNIINARAYAECQIPHVDEPLKFAYRPNMITPRLQAEFQKAQDENATTEGFLAQLEAVISWWDIDWPATNDDGTPKLDGNGQPVIENMPVNRDTLSSMSFVALKALADAFAAEVMPGEKSGSPS